MNRLLKAVRCEILTVPRARGDEPNSRTITAQLTPRSPRSRG